MLSKYQLYLVLNKFFHYPRLTLHIINQLIALLPPPITYMTTNLLTVFIDLPILDMCNEEYAYFDLGGLIASAIIQNLPI